MTLRRKYNKQLNEKININYRILVIIINVILCNLVQFSCIASEYNYMLYNNLSHNDTNTTSNTTQTEQKIENNAENHTVLVNNSKSPTTALYLSIVPGLGQYYVESYWKAPLFFGGAVTLTSLMIHFNDSFISDRDELERLVNPYTNGYERVDISRSNEKHISLTNYEFDNSQFTFLRNRREFNRDNRDRMGFFLGILYLVTAVDAYVGANLYNFNVDDNLTYNIIPNPQNGVTLTLSYKINNKK